MADCLEHTAQVCALLALNTGHTHALAIDVALAHAVGAGANLSEDCREKGGGKRVRGACLLVRAEQG